MTPYQAANELHEMIRSLSITSHEHACAATAVYYQEGSKGKVKINPRLVETRQKLRARLAEINKAFRTLEREEMALRP